MNTSKNITNIEKSWQVYIILASDQKLYTGITTNIRKRWKKHQDKSGAKFFYGRCPQALYYLEGGHSRSSASKREYAIKKLTHIGKWKLILRYFGPHNV